MQNMQYENINIKFILITEEISFLPDNILNTCCIIPVERPSKTIYNKHFKCKNLKDVNTINNIKNLKCDIDIINTHKIICNSIIKNIINYNDLNYSYFRELLYDIFIYNINIFEAIWYILFELVKQNKINKNNINKKLNKTYRFFQYYNNNYRPIYHLESYLLYLILATNEY